MAREDPQLKLRLTDGMRNRLKAAAADNGRSMNAEIIVRLEHTLDEDERRAAVADLDALSQIGEDDPMQAEMNVAIGSAVRRVLAKHGVKAQAPIATGKRKPR